MQRSHRSLIDENERYVSRAAYKLESAAGSLKLNFKGKVVLDVGSSTGGFTDFALKHGATKVIAVDQGTDQMNRLLKSDKRVELHEKTDIRSFEPTSTVDIVLIDVSFVSLKEILPHVSRLAGTATIVAMAKPQFEATDEKLKNKGVIKNEKYRRQVLAELEDWLRPRFVIVAKADSKVEGLKGNKERFYKLNPSK